MAYQNEIPPTSTAEMLLRIELDHIREWSELLHQQRRISKKLHLMIVYATRSLWETVLDASARDVGHNLDFIIGKSKHTESEEL